MPRLEQAVASLEQADWSQPYVFARALNGAPLVAEPAAPERRAQLVANLEEAIAAWRASPTDEQAIIWLGRRAAYLGWYDGARDIFAAGADLHPESARLLRHLGHREITTRRTRRAIEHLSRAAALVEGQQDEVEPDGQPNARGVPRSTLHTNIFYHLGLACYLAGDFPAAADAFGHCMAISPNDDMLVASAYWAFLSQARANGLDVARSVLDRIAFDMDVIENHDYHRLCLLFRGESGIDVEAMEQDAARDALRLATTGYGLAAYRRLQGDEATGTAMLERVRDGVMPAAFGAIAAEADLARLTP